MKRILPRVPIVNSAGTLQSKEIVGEVTKSTIIIIENDSNRVYFDRRTGVCRMNPQRRIALNSLIKLEQFVFENGKAKEGYFYWKSPVRMRTDSAGKVNRNIPKVLNNDVLSWIGNQRCGFKDL